MANTTYTFSNVADLFTQAANAWAGTIALTLADASVDVSAALNNVFTGIADELVKRAAAVPMVGTDGKPVLNDKGEPVYVTVPTQERERKVHVDGYSALLNYRAALRGAIKRGGRDAIVEIFNKNTPYLAVTKANAAAKVPALADAGTPVENIAAHDAAQAANARELEDTLAAKAAECAALLALVADIEAAASIKQVRAMIAAYRAA